MFWLVDLLDWLLGFGGCGLVRGLVYCGISYCLLVWLLFICCAALRLVWMDGVWICLFGELRLRLGVCGVYDWFDARLCFCFGMRV